MVFKPKGFYIRRVLQMGGYFWLRVANSDKNVRNRNDDGDVDRNNAGNRKYAALARFAFSGIAVTFRDFVSLQKAIT